MIEYAADRARGFGREIRTHDDVIDYIASVAGKPIEEVREARGEVGERGEGRVVEVPQVELRAGDDPKAVGLDGYATVYDVGYDIFGGPPFGFTEFFDAGACERSAKEADVRMLINHEGLALGRTRSGTLKLESNDVGLRSIVKALPMEAPTVQDLVATMERDDVDQMSLAFRVLRQEWNEDYTERHIKEVKLYDVSVVTFPANPATSVRLTRPAAVAGRSYDLALRQFQLSSRR